MRARKGKGIVAGNEGAHSRNVAVRFPRRHLTAQGAQKAAGYAETRVFA